MDKKVKALVLFSGGLDSRLVIKILQEQKINLIALHFILPFGTGCCSEKNCVFNFSQVAGIKLEFVDCSQGKNFREYLEIIKNPRFGHGTGINPCIDCRIFILKKAKALMKKLGADFIATGEVLGERPMSQHLRALKLIEKETRLENKILRPLSAKLLEETEVEKKGLVNREKLYAISGRRRLSQMELAKKYGLKDYPSPAGGCLLCDKEFSKRFKQMLENFGDINENDAEILKFGRHFWVETRSATNINTKKHEYNSDGHFRVPQVCQLAGEGYAFTCLIVVGRNQEENQKIKKLAKKGDILIELKEIPGPTTLIRGKKISQKIIKEAKKLTKKYTNKARGREKMSYKILKK